LKPVRKAALFILLTAVPALYIPAQTTNTSELPLITSKAPQWVKDLRRWEIVAFGTIPFTMFTATFAMDMHRWNKNSNMDFSAQGRRYAPWPLKSAGAVAMEKREQEMVFIIAGSLSAAIAIADMIIVQVQRHKERKRVEALPVGTAIIIRKPWPEGTEQDGNNADAVPLDGSVPNNAPKQP
jgi:hypothetical protein